MEQGSWQKSSQEMVELFQTIAPGPPAESRKMFGYPCAFLGGNLFMGLFVDNLFLRLGDEDRAALEAQGGSPFAPMAGRPMKGYVVVPQAMLSDLAGLDQWVARSLEFAGSLPVKVPKPRKPKAAKG
jgi:TfoX/Sxy family transcriptional regulator of competence genes